MICIQLLKLFQQKLKYQGCAAGQIKAEVFLTGRMAMMLWAGGIICFFTKHFPLKVAGLPDTIRAKKKYL
jgi:hypothetical protein